MTDLSAAARVSLGHVSNVRKLLLDQEWAAAERTGLRVTRPDDLLQAWGSAYRPRIRVRETLYTALHGERLDAAVRAALADAGSGSHLLLASFSAARWLAPYARQATTFFFALTYSSIELCQSMWFLVMFVTTDTFGARPVGPSQ